MKHKTIILVSIFLFLSGFFPQGFSISDSIDLKKNSQEWYVDASNYLGPWDGSINHPFRYITDATTAAHPYDTVFVLNATYCEALIISVPLSLIGISTPILDGSYNQTVLTVKTDDVLIKNFIICHSGGFSDDAGIFFDFGSNISIIDCVVHHTKNGVSVNHCSDVVLKGCSFFHNGNGIKVQGSDDVSIQGCDFAHNAIALVGLDSTNVSVLESTFQANGISGVFYQASSLQFKNCNLSDNSVNKGGFIFTNVSDTSLYNCLFYHNGDGLSIAYCNNMTIDHCSFLFNTHFALSMRQPSKNIYVTSSNISNNLRTAFYLEPGNRCTIHHSHIVGNYLYSISAEPLVMYWASENWWGTSLGPLYPQMCFTNKIKYFWGLSHCFPWSSCPYESVGAFHLEIPSPRCNHSFDEPLSYDIQGNDTDGDGAPDWWESKWGYGINYWEDHSILDPDEDALTNIEECFTDSYGSNPFLKDVFLEIDWMMCPEPDINRPNETLLQMVIDSFAMHNISLHIDIGALGGGEPIPDDCDHRVVYTALEDLYWQYFLHNDLKNPRKGIFHYGIICNYCPDLNFPFMGWDAFDGFAVSAEWLEQDIPWYDREHLIVGGIMHHLGHTLGLIADTFPGIDNVDVIQPFSLQWFRYRDYKSSMNYLYKFTVFTYSDGSNGQGDFSDWDHLRFGFFKDSMFPV